MLHKYLKILLLIAIISSFITHTIAIDSENFVVARMTFSDIFGLLSLVLFLGVIFKKKEVLFQFIPTLKYPFILVFGLACSVFLSLNVNSTIAEILILMYLVLLSGVLIYTFKNNLVSLLFPVLIITLFVTSFIGLYDLLARNFELPVFFNAATKNRGVSGFRYFGQAANYSFTLLTIVIPLRYSNYYNELPVISKTLFPSAIISGTLFLFSSGRISIILCFMLAMLIYLLLNRNRLKRKHVLLFFSGVVMAVLFSKYVTPNLYQNIVYRLQSRITNRVIGTPEADFIVTNFKGALQAFLDNPITGSGLGAFVNNYSKFEIHGTYLKMLGETGSIGALAYVIFLGSFLYMIYKIIKKRAYVYKNYMIQMLPFVAASLISWSYNHHLRKKEFWILYAVITIVYLNMNTNLMSPNSNETKTH